MANKQRLIKVCDATAVYNGIALYMAENAYLNDTALDVLKMVAKWLDEAPTVEAEPVVHGRWVKHNFLGHEQWACSECQTLGSPQWKRCPVCEAKMDGGNEDG